jgi:hypothetical protein
MNSLSHFFVIIDSIVGTGYLDDNNRRGFHSSRYGKKAVPGDSNPLHQRGKSRGKGQETLCLK